MNGKERIQAILGGERPDRTPVFPLLMAFAAKRIGASYRDFASNGSVMAQAQIHAHEVFHLDAITACSDAFRIAADLGAEMVFPEDKPPFAQAPLVTSAEDLKRLKRPDVANARGRMYDRAQGVKEMVNAVGKSCMVLGWVDMPFAEICSLCGVQNIMMMMYDEPELVHQLLDFVTSIVIDFALLQIENGAEMIGCGDAAASLISPEMYREFALPYEQQVCEAIHHRQAKIKLHICGDTTALLQDMVKSGADLFNVDHMVDLKTAAETYGAEQLAFKGNLDPIGDILQASAEESYCRAKRCIQLTEGYRYILSAGCEIPAEVEDEVFLAFCRAAEQ